MRGRKALVIVAVMLMVCSLGLTGCSKKKAKTAPEQPSDLPESGMMSEPLDSTGDSGIMEGRTSGPMVPVYFAFDSSSIEGEQTARMETNADFLKKNPNVSIDLSGLAKGNFTTDWFLNKYEDFVSYFKMWMTYLGDYNKLIFGTDWPVVSIESYIALI